MSSVVPLHPSSHPVYVHQVDTFSDAWEFAGFVRRPREHTNSSKYVAGADVGRLEIF
jgi:hypothetical protein